MPRPAAPVPTSHPHAWRVVVNHGTRRGDKVIRVEQYTPGEDARAIAILHAQAISALRQAARRNGQTVTFPDYVAKMAEFGVQVAPRFSTTAPERAPGLAFKTASTTLFASDIATVEGRRSPLSWDQIAAAGIDCDLTRDLPFLQKLAERGSDAIRSAIKDEVLPAVTEGREVIAAGFAHAISDQEKRVNGRLIADILANGYHRHFVETGDRTAGRFFDITDAVGLKWDDNEKRLKDDPAAVSKVFSYHDTTQAGRVYLKNAYADARTFRMTRRRHYGSLADAIRQVRGYAMLNDPIDPTQAETRSLRRAYFTGGTPGGEGANARKYDRRALDSAGLAILAKARGLPPGSEHTVYAARHGRITFDQALAAARMAGCDLPPSIAHGIGGKDGMTEAEEWAMQEMRARVALGMRPVPSEIGLGDLVSDSGFKNRAPQEGDLRLLTKRGLPEAIAWIASSRFQHLARDGYRVERVEAAPPTITKRLQNWLPIDVDGFEPPSKEKLHRVPEWRERYPDGLDVAARPDEFVRWWSETFLPRPFKGVYTYWQHSSSAGWETVYQANQQPKHAVYTGRMPKASMHMFVPLEGFHDIDVIGAWVTAAAKKNLADLIEKGVIDPVNGGKPLKAVHLDPAWWTNPIQPIYCRPPRIEDLCGNPEPDPLTRRDGEIAGAPGVLVPASITRAGMRIIEEYEAKADERLKALGFRVGFASGPDVLDADVGTPGPRTVTVHGTGRTPLEAMILAARIHPMGFQDGHRVGFHQQIYTGIMFWMEAAYARDSGRFSNEEERCALADECTDDMMAILRGVYEEEVGYPMEFDTGDYERYVNERELRRSAGLGIENLLKTFSTKPEKKAEVLARYGVKEQDAAAAKVVAAALSARAVEAPSL